MRRGGGLIVAIKTGVGLLDTATGAFTSIVDPEADLPLTRINDAKVDRAGRFWFGTTSEDGAAVGALYRMDADRSVNVLDRGYTIPNGFAWSLDGRRMYVADTPLRELREYDGDFATGAVAGRRVFAVVPADAGTPDGTTVDSAGFVWSACNGGGRIVRYAPDGSLDRTIDVPATLVTNVTFGGDDLRTLFITTASRGLSADELRAQPLAGAVLAVRVDVPGVPEPAFAG